jgi:flagellar protein FlgJ
VGRNRSLSRAGSSAAGAAAEGSATASGAASVSAEGASATAAGNSCPSSAQQAAFAQALWPDAQQAARQLGVNPVTLLAQAALETNWGRSVPQSANGATSNNLFGIKATAAWSGPAVANETQEYSGGSASTVKAQFRAYGSAGQCFQDYVDLLKSNPRYAAALGTGNDVQAFGSALQQGGYATDPAYASKLTAVAGTLAHALTHAAAVAPGSAPSASLKFAANLPTTDGSGTLQRR